MSPIFSKNIGLFLRGVIYYGCWIVGCGMLVVGCWLNKLLSSGQGRNPLKYTNCGICISLKRKLCPLEETMNFH
jgi:hypothetical protein